MLKSFACGEVKHDAAYIMITDPWQLPWWQPLHALTS
jgi:hypothetical protein